ncbi:MAG TPA: phage tail protein [Caldilineaceae bacterium]|nr:phage tail protein [Caldilineaceae bacterium]
MAEFRDRPYSAFNFLVKLGDEGDPNSVQAGFQEVTGLGMEITVQEYRAGNSLENAPLKITGMHKVTDVTLKRGVIGALDLYTWLDQVRNGRQDALRTVVIQLQNEDHSAVVMEWKLNNARPIKYTGPSFNGKGTDVAIEELVIAAERITLA